MERSLQLLVLLVLPSQAFGQSGQTAQCYATVAAGCTLTGTCNGPDISPSNPVSYGIGASDSPACYTLITRSSGGVVTVYRGHATTTCVNHCYSAMATHSAIVTGGGAIYYRCYDTNLGNSEDLSIGTAYYATSNIACDMYNTASTTVAASSTEGTTWWLTMLAVVTIVLAVLALVGGAGLLAFAIWLCVHRHKRLAYFGA